MNKALYKILLVDDDRFVLDMLVDLFHDEYTTFTATTGNEAIEVVRDNPDIAAVVMDIKMSGIDGITAARRIREFNPDIRIIFHTGYPGDYDEDEISEQEHPFDYIEKGDSISKLTRSVYNAVESYHLLKDNRSMTEYARSMYKLIGKSEVMQNVYQRIRKVAPSDNKVMIFGETGTGKERVARAIHSNSPRRDKRMAVLSCHQKPHDLVEAELFGHVRGTFTNAYETREGLFEYANGGTVFLDEIGDLDITTQANLLRVLESGEFCKVGSPEIKHTNVRILCATHKDLEKLVKEGKFREDLYYRLKGIIITLPPLRERREDIPLLVEKFIDQFTIERSRPPKVFEQEVINFLINHDWPGNVRQLEDMVESLIDLTDSDIVFIEDVHDYFNCTQNVNNHNNGDRKSLRLRVDEFRRNCIIETLEETRGNVTKAARLLQIDRANLKKLLDRYKLNSGK